MFINFVERIPIILGTPTISHIINIMKEREIDALMTPWVNARVAYLLSVQRATTIMADDLAMEVENAYTGEHINVMTQVLQIEDGSLPQGLMVQNAYTELRKGSKNSVVVVRNSMV